MTSSHLDTRASIALSDGMEAVLLPVQTDQIVRTYRDGDHLVVALADGRELLLEGWFSRLEEGVEVALLARDGNTGEIVAVSITELGEYAGARPVALGRLEEMFGADADAIEEALQKTGVSAQAEAAIGAIPAELVSLMVVGSVILVGTTAIVVASEDDGEDPGPIVTDIGLDYEPVESGEPPAGRSYDIDRDGTIDRYEWFDDEGSVVRIERDVDDNGSIDRTEHDEDSDGTPESIVHDADSLGVDVRTEHDDDDNGSIDRTEHDADGDGIPERIVHDADAAGVDVRTEYDDNGDGNADRIDTNAYENGLLTTKSTDSNADGIHEQVETYSYDANGTLARTEYDIAPAGGTVDGVTDRIEVFGYENGRLAMKSIDRNASDDGVYEEVENYHYDANGTVVRTEYDIAALSTGGTVDGTVDRTEHDADGDGTPERIVNDADSDGADVRTEYDANENGTFERTEHDADGDGTAERVEYDQDENGITDLTVSDSDGDGYPDLWEYDEDEDGATEARGYDTDNNGTVNHFEIQLGGTALRFDHDRDENGTTDLRAFDEDGDRTAERLEYDADENGMAEATGYDTDDDGTVNYWDIDVNEDGTPDGYVLDEDDNGSPDFSQVDSDLNGVFESATRSPDAAGSEVIRVDYLLITQPTEMISYDRLGRIAANSVDSDQNGTAEEYQTYIYDSYDPLGRVVEDAGDSPLDGPTFKYVYHEVDSFEFDENGQRVPITVSVIMLDENGDPVVETDANGLPVLAEVLDENGNPVLDVDGSPMLYEGGIDGQPDDIRYYFHGAYIPTSPDGRVRVVKADSPQSEGQIPTEIAIDFDGDGTADASGAPAGTVETSNSQEGVGPSQSDPQMVMLESEINLPLLETAFFRPDDTTRDPENPYWFEAMLHDYEGYPIRATIIAGDSIYNHGEIARIDMDYSYHFSNIPDPEANPPIEGDGPQPDDGYVSRIQYSVTHGTADDATADREWGEAFSYTFTEGPDGTTQIVDTIKKDVYSTNPDGTEDPDRAELYHYDENGMIESVEIDSAGPNGSGTADGIYDSTETYFYGPGAFYGEYHDAGKMFVYKTVDEGRDGTVDSLNFANGVNFTFAPGADEVDALVGITQINMSGTADDPAYPAILTNGVTTLAISDEVLSALADRDGDGAADTGYELVIDSDGANDVVQLGTGFTSVAASNGRDGYQGTDGIIYIDPQITVEMA